MRILFVTRAPFGLMGTNASYMFPHYASKSHRVTVLSPQPKRAELDKIVFKDDNIELIEITNEDIYKRAQEVAVWIETLKPDIVHVFSHPKAILYPLVYKKWKPDSPVKWYFDIRSHIFGGSALSRGKERLFNTLLQGKFDFTSATAPMNYTSYFPFPRQPYTWVPIGVNMTEFPDIRVEERLPSRFVFVGSIAKVRQLEVMVEGFGKFTQAAGPGYTLDLFGDGNLVPALAQLIESRGWSDSIALKGVLPASEVFSRLGDYDAGLVYLPKDAFNHAPALKRIEYAAAGIDIIESDTAWHLENPEGFQTFQFSNTPAGMCQTLLDYIKQPRRLARAQHNRTQAARFDWNYIIENDVTPIYNRLCPAPPVEAEGVTP